MLCEMCGKETGEIKLVKVEGAVLHLCAACSRFGTDVDPGPAPVAQRGGGLPVRVPTRRSRAEERDIYSEMPDIELQEDWTQRIRRARESRGMTQEQFGAVLREKTSVIHKLESGEIVPPDALVLKIEHILKIRLRAPPGSS